jgi:hypothetical protein
MRSAQTYPYWPSILCRPCPTYPGLSRHSKQRPQSRRQYRTSRYERLRNGQRSQFVIRTREFSSPQCQRYEKVIVRRCDCKSQEAKIAAFPKSGNGKTYTVTYGILCMLPGVRNRSRSPAGISSKKILRLYVKQNEAVCSNRSSSGRKTFPPGAPSA